MRALPAALLGTFIGLTGCAASAPTLPIVDQVDLPRFMGDWYVIANIPTSIEKEAYNAVESYAMSEPGRIETTFRFNKGSADGKQKVYSPTGFVGEHPSNAIWGMRFIWPIKAEYLITRLNDDYTQTIIGRSKRDYVWIMARQPAISDSDYADHVEYLKQVGYDTDKLRKVPQQWADL
ncbi:MAG: lipocalin family protein [Gammaproteobacteria bacterium]